MSFSVNHEWDEGGNCSIGVSEDIPCWRFSLWDIAGIAIATVGGIFGAIGFGIGAAAREFQAVAEYNRRRYEEDREAHEQECARAEMAGTLEGMTIFGLDDLEEGP